MELKTGVLETHRIVTAPLLLLILVLTVFQEFQHVCSLPVRKPVESSVPVRAASRVGDERDRGRAPAAAVRPRRDIGLVGANETAAGVIYHVNEREYLLN